MFLPLSSCGITEIVFTLSVTSSPVTPLPDSSSSEVILSLGCESPDEVRKLAEAAFALGARKVNEIDDKGFMISWGFEDLDGHLWDLFWMDPKHLEG